MALILTSGAGRATGVARACSSEWRLSSAAMLPVEALLGAPLLIGAAGADGSGNTVVGPAFTFSARQLTFEVTDTVLCQHVRRACAYAC